MQLAVVEVVVGRDRVSVGSDDRERELAGVGETVFGHEVVAVLGDEQPAGRSSVVSFIVSSIALSWLGLPPASIGPAAAPTAAPTPSMATRATP